MLMPRLEISPQELGKKLFHRIVDNAVTDRGALLAYYFIFALFPFLFFLVTLAAYLPLKGSTEDLVSRLSQVMPPQAFSIVSGELTSLVNQPRPHLLTLGLLLTLWSSSRAVDALRGALNLAYDVKETRPFWKTQGMALLITISAGTLTLVALLLLAAGGNAGLWVANHLGAGKGWILLWGWLRWPITAVIIMLVAAMLYYLLPDVEQEWRFITPGSVVGTGLWLLGSWGFTLYVDHFGNYTRTYGSIGGVIVLLTWLYLSGLIFVLGGEINALVEHVSPEGKAVGARKAGETPVPAADRPSAAAPGASSSRGAAVRSHFNFLRRKHGAGAPAVAIKEQREGKPLAMPDPPSDTRH